MNFIFIKQDRNHFVWQYPMLFDLKVSPPSQTTVNLNFRAPNRSCMPAASCSDKPLAVPIQIILHVNNTEIKYTCNHNFFVNLLKI